MCHFKFFSSLDYSAIITGAFGGVVAATTFAIVADLFRDEQRGRVMGYIQLAFAASLIIGLPLALYLANRFNWRLTYWLFFGSGILVFSMVYIKVEPIVAHLSNASQEQVLKHAACIINKRDYWTVFLNNIFLVLGDAMFMTFSSATAQ
ncbi:MAG: MFS transporter [Bacteroidia bacterium]